MYCSEAEAFIIVHTEKIECVALYWACFIAALEQRDVC